MRIGAVAGHFGRDLDRAVAKVEGIVRDARRSSVDLLVLPHATLGGYLTDLQDPDPLQAPPGVDVRSELLGRIAAVAGPVLVCLGFTEVAAGRRYSTAVCLSAEGQWGRHRKVHQPLAEATVYDAGSSFAAFDTPLGRLGLLIDYDKTFPEAARTLALDGAELIACLSAWPASTTDRASRLPQDRQSRLFDLYDSARAAENQVVWVSSNQTGRYGQLRFLGRAKVVGPGGDVLARTSGKGGLVTADVDVSAEVARARRVLHHLRELRPEAYRLSP